MAKTSKYGASTARSQQKRQNAQRSLKLQWLRDGQKGEALDAFRRPLQEELEAIEAEGREAAEATVAGEDSDDGAADCPVATGALAEAIAESVPEIAAGEEGHVRAM